MHRGESAAGYELRDRKVGNERALLGQALRHRRHPAWLGFRLWPGPSSRSYFRRARASQIPHHFTSTDRTPCSLPRASVLDSFAVGFVPFKRFHPLGVYQSSSPSSPGTRTFARLAHSFASAGRLPSTLRLVSMSPKPLLLAASRQRCKMVSITASSRSSCRSADVLKSDQHSLHALKVSATCWWRVLAQAQNPVLSLQRSANQRCT